VFHSQEIIGLDAVIHALKVELKDLQVAFDPQYFDCRADKRRRTDRRNRNAISDGGEKNHSKCYP